MGSPGSSVMGQSWQWGTVRILLALYDQHPAVGEQTSSFLLPFCLLPTPLYSLAPVHGGIMHRLGA